MQKLCQQIIQKFELKLSDIKNYDYNSQNQEGSVKLQNAYDYFLQVAPFSEKNLLYTQFTQKLKKAFVNKQQSSNAKKRYSETKYGQVQSFVFILIRQKEEKLCVLRYPQQTQFYNFFYIWAYSYKQAELQFVRDFQLSFNIKLTQNQFYQKEDKIQIQKNEFNLVYVDLSQKQMNADQITNIKQNYQIDIEIIDRNSQELIENKDFFILKNFLPSINQYFENANKKEQDLSQQVETRQKANSDPPRPESLELTQSDSEIEENITNRDVVQKESSLNTRMKSFESSLDDILKKYGINVQLQL